MEVKAWVGKGGTHAEQVQINWLKSLWLGREINNFQTLIRSQELNIKVPTNFSDKLFLDYKIKVG